MGIQGIIRPPPEIRAVADKTASFVAKNGRAFETRIVNSAKGKTPKFAFLHESSPFHAYYEDRIVFFANAGGNDAKKKNEEDEKKKTNEVKVEEEKQKDGGEVLNKANESSEESVKIKKEEGGDEGGKKSESDGGDGDKDGDQTSKTPLAAAQDKLTARKATSSVDPVARALLAQRAKINAMLREAEVEEEQKEKDGSSSGITRMDVCIPVNSSTPIKEEEEKKTSNGGEDGDTPHSSAASNNNKQNNNTPKEPPAPLPPIFTTILPPKNISPSQLEIIKLTAQFVVLNGKGGPFLRELTVRFWQGHHYSVWGFLQPRHAHYAYFTQLVDLYKRLMQQAMMVHEQHQYQQKKKNQVIGGGGGGDSGKDEEKEEQTKKEDGNSGSTLLEIASLKRMVGLEGSTLSISVSGSGSDANNNTDHHSIDDDNLKILHRIQGTAGNVSKCLEHAAYHAEHHRYREEQRRIALENNGGDGAVGNGLGGAAKVDWHDFVVVETIEFAVDEVVEVLPPPPPPPPVTEDTDKDEASNKEEDGKKRKRDNNSMDESSDEDDEEEGIKVVSASEYAPKVVSSQAKFASEARTHVIDPITKKSIPIAEMSEHMRIQLLDPKWAKEKQKFMEKQKESNLVSGDAIARNMNAFAKARTDLFGSSSAEDLPRDVKQNLEASKAMHEQAQMPQPRPIQVAPIPPPPPPPPSGPTSVPVSTKSTTLEHARPADLVYPTAKKARIDDTTTITGSSISQGQRKITTAPTPPVPPSVVPPAAPIPVPAPGVPVPVEPNDIDTEVLQNLSEGDFAKSMSSPNVPVTISVPNDPSYSSWGFNGQTLSITVDVMTKVKALKKQLQSQLGGDEVMPVNKMQLKSPTAGFLKDSLSLAYLNIGPNHGSLELVPKVRGGKRK